MILIDDNPIGHMAWQHSAEKNGKSIRVFSTLQEFLAEVREFDRKTPIYLDWDLGEGSISGSAAGQIISNEGFKTIYVATGYEPDSLPSLPWVTKIVGKAPPWK